MPSVISQLARRRLSIDASETQHEDRRGNWPLHSMAKIARRWVDRGIRTGYVHGNGKRALSVNRNYEPDRW